MTHSIGAQGPLGAYAGLFLLLALAWAGLPTAGQAALVAAGVLASEGKLDITLVIVVGTVGSMAGGIAGYWLGWSGGRAAWSAPGPLLNRRLTALESGERAFARYGALAVFVVPMWLAGIVRMPWRAFLLWGTLAALAWTLAGGLGGYLIGPQVLLLLKKAQWAVIAAAVVVTAGVFLYRRRKAARSASSSTESAASGSAANE
jgi:membrane protein DedA with SNARE-associated domain